MTTINNFMKNVSQNIFPYIYTILIGLLVIGIFYSLFLISVGNHVSTCLVSRRKYKEKLKIKTTICNAMASDVFIASNSILYTANIKSG